VLIVFALALIFAHLLAPVVNVAERFAPRRVPRVAVLAMVYVVLVGLLVLAAIPLGERLSHEALVLAHRLPAALEGDPLANLPIPRFLESFRPRVTAFTQDRLHDLGQTLTPTLSAVGTHILNGLGVLVALVLIPILSFFFLKDGPAMRAGIVDSFDPSRQKLIDDLFSDIHILLAQYIRALVILSIATFTAYAIVFSVLGMPFALLLSGFAALLEFIPAVGPFVAGMTIIVAALFSGFEHFIILIVFLGLYRIFQDYVLNPYLMSAGVELHPLLVLFGILAGSELFGVPGMFFSVPVMAALRLIILRLRRRQVRLVSDSPVPAQATE
jgi:predicted PurR-regulated permease PerM